MSQKRFKPEHTGPGGVRVVYRSKSEEEAKRRAAKAMNLVGTPFLCLPGHERTDAAAHAAIAFTSSNGTPVPLEAVEMVFNDALLMDAVSNWGEDGPLYRDTLPDPSLQLEVYEWAQRAYSEAGVEIPAQLKRPEAAR